MSNKRKAEWPSQEKPPTMESLDMHLKAGLKLLELSDRKAIAVYRQTAIQLFKYAVYHLQSKKETFRLILGYIIIKIIVLRLILTTY